MLQHWSPTLCQHKHWTKSSGMWHWSYFKPIKIRQHWKLTWRWKRKDKWWKKPLLSVKALHNALFTILAKENAVINKSILKATIKWYWLDRIELERSTYYSAMLHNHAYDQVEESCSSLIKFCFSLFYNEHPFPPPTGHQHMLWETNHKQIRQIIQAIFIYVLSERNLSSSNTNLHSAADCGNGNPLPEHLWSSPHPAEKQQAWLKWWQSLYILHMWLASWSTSENKSNLVERKIIFPLLSKSLTKNNCLNKYHGATPVLLVIKTPLTLFC